MASVDCNSEQTLALTEDEAYALLLMCLLSPMKLDEDAEGALRKLADFCKHKMYSLQHESAERPRE